MKDQRYDKKKSLANESDRRSIALVKKEYNSVKKYLEKSLVNELKNLRKIFQMMYLNHEYERVDIDKEIKKLNELLKHNNIKGMIDHIGSHNKPLESSSPSAQYIHYLYAQSTKLRQLSLAYNALTKLGNTLHQKEITHSGASKVADNLEQFRFYITIDSLKMECSDYKKYLDRIINKESINDFKYSRKKQNTRLQLATNQSNHINLLTECFTSTTPLIEQVENFREKFTNPVFQELISDTTDSKTQKFSKNIQVILSIATLGIGAIPFAAYSKITSGTGFFWHSENKKVADRISEKLESSLGKKMK